MTPTGFATWNDYFSFVLAREYVSSDTGEIFPVKKGPLEKFGRACASLAVQPVDFLLREIRNPLVLLSMTVGALFLTSVAFYPTQTWNLAAQVLPFIKGIKSYHVHAFFYGTSQSVILGLGTQALGRLRNPALMEAFQNKRIIPISIGTHRGNL